MERITGTETAGSYTIENLEAAIERLAAFEDAYYELIEMQEKLTSELERLRGEGKEKTVKFREILGQKMMNLNAVMFFERHGIK